MAWRPILVVCFPAIVFAQQALTLDGAVRMALESHPLVASGRESIVAARGLERQARLTFNPRLNMQVENLRIPRAEPFVYGQDTDNFAFLQQTFETAGKRSLRGEVAARQIRRNELELAILERNIRLRVTEAWWRALAAQRTRDLIVETLKTFEQTVEYHRVRVKEGAMAEADLIRVQVEAGRFSLAANEAELEEAQARIGLFREMGRTSFPEVRLEGLLEPPASDPVWPPVEQALSRRPEIQLARALLDQANARTRLEEANARPNIDILGGYKRTNGFDTALAGLQFDLPVRNRNQGNIEAASAEARAARANLAAAEALVEAETRAARVEFETRRQQVRDYLPRLLSQAEETARIARGA
ncbi:MAG: TolC family protein, partial [Bryobacteraceae bacterium]|nr:TolC family protein [Bryobacteraceae bacterium]